MDESFLQMVSQARGGEASVAVAAAAATGSVLWARWASGQQQY